MNICICVMRNGLVFLFLEVVLHGNYCSQHMLISTLPNVKCYGSFDSYRSNDGVRSAMTRNRFMNVLQNLHFTDNQTDDEFDKAYKVHIDTNYLNKAFQDAMADVERQSID